MKKSNFLNLTPLASCTLEPHFSGRGLKSNIFCLIVLVPKRYDYQSKKPMEAMDLEEMAFSSPETPTPNAHPKMILISVFTLKNSTTISTPSQKLFYFVVGKARLTNKQTQALIFQFLHCHTLYAGHRSQFSLQEHRY